MSDRQHTLFHVALILATPFLILAIHPNLFINPNTNAWIDNWVYNGFFQDLPDQLERWEGTYYATRLSWLLPGFAVHQLFPPLVANYVLHIGFFYTLLFSTYFLAASAVNRTTAFIVTMLAGWNPELLASMSWDYVDGAVITYFVASLLCVEKASAGSHRWPWALAAGVALACLASANLVGTTLWPVCGLFLVLRVGIRQWRTTARIVGIAGIGAAATFIALGLANYQLGGAFLYLAPSVDYATTRMWVQSPWDVEGLGWLPDAPHLVLPAVAVVGAIVALAGRSHVLKSFSGCVQVSFLVAAVWWVIHSTLWTHSLHISYYVSYLLPLGLLALTVHPDSPANTSVASGVRRAIALEVGVVALLMLHLFIFRDGDSAWTAVETVLQGVSTPYGINAFVAFAFASIVLVSLRFIRGARFRWPAFLLVLLLACSSVPTNWAASDTPRLQEDFAVTVSAHEFIGQHLDPDRGLRVWYMLAPGERRPFKNISSTYLWGWSLINETMPSLDQAQIASLVPDTQLVMMAATQPEVDTARHALQNVGFDYTPRVQQEFGNRDARFLVIVGDLVREQ